MPRAAVITAHRHTMNAGSFTRPVGMTEPPCMPRSPTSRCSTLASLATSSSASPVTRAAILRRTLMPDRCEPPPEFRGERWHFIGREPDENILAQFVAGKYWDFGDGCEAESA